MRAVATTDQPAAGRSVGRPTKFTAERRERILTAIRAGSYAETAALATGIGKSTFYEWLERFPEFADAVKSARAEAETRYVAVIEEAAASTWQAAAWWLERSAPDRWGRRERRYAAVDDPVAPPVPEPPRRRTVERRAELIEIAREAGLMGPQQSVVSAGTDTALPDPSLPH